VAPSRFVVSKAAVYVLDHSVADTIPLCITRAPLLWEALSRLADCAAGRRGVANRAQHRTILGPLGKSVAVTAQSQCSLVGHGVFGGKGVAMTAINKEPGRREIEELLPWHATGTLSRRDADRVEQALAGDRELARRYDLVLQELAETIHLNETIGAPSPRAMEKLFAAIDAEVADAPRPRRRRTSRPPSLATASTLTNNTPGAQC
jgi:hypothetical protein